MIIGNLHNSRCMVASVYNFVIITVFLIIFVHNYTLKSKRLSYPMIM
jgi:hypothetical protein